MTILRSIKAKTHDYLRYRKARTRTTGKNVRFPLPRLRKTVRFDRQRPKLTVFRIAHPPPGRGSWPPSEGHSPPGRRGSRHRGGKTAQNREAQRRSEGRGPQDEGAAPSSKGLCKRHGTKHGFLCMLEPLTVHKPLRALTASRYSVRKRKRPHKATRAKEQAWKRLG